MLDPLDNTFLLLVLYVLDQVLDTRLLSYPIEGCMSCKCHPSWPGRNCAVNNYLHITPEMSSK